MDKRNGLWLGSAQDTQGKVITCKAALVWGPSKPLVIQQVQVDPPKQTEVRIKILFTSICHTDLSAWKGENEAQQAYPRILGHEAAGIVESVGEDVEDLEVGDNVIPIFNGECGKCRVCKSDKANLCETYQVDPMKKVMKTDGKTRFSTIDGEPIYHFLNTSTFSEYTVIDSACVVKIDPLAPLAKMSLLSCAISTGVGAVWNVADVQAGSTVAIFGLGAVGLAVAEGTRARGASKIIGVDINPEKFSLGKAAGITDFINPRDQQDKAVNEIIGEITGGGVDYSFECAGNIGALRDAFLSTRPGLGLTVLLGIHTTQETLPIHPMELFVGRSITASVFGGFKGKTQLPSFVKECMQGVVNLDFFITHELPFKEINQALELLDKGKTLRCLLHLTP